jgi:short-subunit dehydrogenase
MAQPQNKVVLITGASGGIGAACAAQFRRKGAKVSLTDLENSGFADFDDNQTVISVGDITVEAFRETIFRRTIDQFGRIDILINNAGVGLFVPPSTVDVQVSKRLFDVNVFAPLALMQLVIPQMRSQHSGTIVNVGSLGGSVSFPWAGIYCASKFAMHGINDALRRELSASGIRVIRVCPGPVRTSFNEHALSGKAPQRVTRLRRLASVSPDQVAKAIVKAIESRGRIVYVPSTARVFMAAEFFASRAVDWYLRRQW